MLRETDFSHTHEFEEAPVWPVLNREPVGLDPVPAVVDEALSFRAAPSTPDVPASVGGLLFAAYLSLIGALAIATAARGSSAFVIVIAALFVIAFFVVPRFIFAQEKAEAKRPTMHRFLADGLVTYTGHSGGGAALVQMLIVPVALAGGVLAMAVVIALL